ncbi:MAG: hypothetical protein KDD64_16365, partial [Bdellovibrionales bacterium]|nr:hypothetical protein [Bdellovibrionales bacterium]
MDLLEQTTKGLYCRYGDFYVDPLHPVPRAVVTHAHADHVRPGSRNYFCSRAGHELVRLRTQTGAKIESASFGERRKIGDVLVSFHPAGHILGSSQIRIELGGFVTVVSGDYKVENDPTSGGFEPVPCHHFFSEATFAAPVYRWPTEESVKTEILNWWHENQRSNRTSIIYAYALGKSQRLLSLLGRDALGPIGVHGAVRQFLGAYQRQG